jgi:hypothetical protein
MKQMKQMKNLLNSVIQRNNGNDNIKIVILE